MFAEMREIIENYDRNSDFYSLNQVLKKLLQSLIVDQSLIAEIASNSYRHQLGFEKYTLHTFNDGYSLRLHYWDNLTISKEDIHSHCANFKSIVLHGSMINNIFELESGKDSKVFSYSFNSEKKNSVACEEGFSNVRFIESNILNSSDYYNQLSSSLHKIDKIYANTLTLSLWGEREYSALVLKDVNSSPQDCSCSCSFKPTEVIEKINQILRNM